MKVWKEWVEECDYVGQDASKYLNTLRVVMHFLEPYHSYYLSL